MVELLAGFDHDGDSSGDLGFVAGHADLASGQMQLLDRLEQLEQRV